MKIKALVYCRVSSDRQKNEGHGLDSQEQRCRSYSLGKGYEVEEVFRDSFTGGGDFMDRPAMRALLAYIDSKPHENFVVVFDDLKRFARDVVNHVKLRQALDARNAKVECPNFTFEDTPEGEYVELILAAGAQLERKQNRRQVIQKQKARLEAGYWSFCHPPGYRFARDPLHGKILVPDPRVAPIITEVLKGYAAGRFETLTEVNRFLESRGFAEMIATKRRKHKSGAVYSSQAERLLSRVIYAGIIEYPEWGVKRRVGHHKPLITLDEYEAISERLRGKKSAFKRSRKDTSPLFPLRGFVLCPSCQKTMTASVTTKKNKKGNLEWPYYRCTQTGKHKEGCGKSYKADLVHMAFEETLQDVEPDEKVFSLVKAITRDLWEKQKGAIKNKRKDFAKTIQAQQFEIDTLTEKILTTKEKTLTNIYEQKLITISERLEENKTKIASLNVSEDSFGTALEEVFNFVKSPYQIWTSGDINDKKLVLKLAFAEEMAFNPEKGFGTPKLSAIFNVFEDFAKAKSPHVEMGRIALPCSN